MAWDIRARPMAAIKTGPEPHRSPSSPRRRAFAMMWWHPKAGTRSWLPNRHHLDCLIQLTGTFLEQLLPTMSDMGTVS